MIQQLGDFEVNSVIDLMWATNGQDGASITRSTNGSIRIYKNNSTTERTSSNGITDTEDFDSLTGLHHLRIDTSDNTDAGFYAAGNNYFVVLQGAVIDTKTVNTCLAQFSIAHRQVAQIKTKTDALPSDPADASDVAAAVAAVSAKIDTVDDFLDTEIAAIKAKTDSLTFTVAGVVDANIQRVNDVTVTGTGAPGDEWGP